jgi:hypothetical protein
MTSGLGISSPGLGAFGGVIAIQVSGGRSGASFDGNLESGFRQAGDDGGHQGDAPLAGEGFPGNTDDHT